MSRVCQVSQKKANNGYSVSHSHIRNKKIQNVNLQSKKIWSNKNQGWIKLKISVKALKSLRKNGFN